MNDRICIASQGNITALYSPQKLISCCTDCGNGCGGGYTAAALNYVLKRGIVTGGDYGSDKVPIYITHNIFLTDAEYTFKKTRYEYFFRNKTY